MSIDMSKYRFYTNGENTVVAVSSYAGRPVRGVAKCDPRDSFDLENGKELAAARCNEKVAKKRYARAHKLFYQSHKALDQARLKYDKMFDYCNNAIDELEKAKTYCEVVKAKINNTAM